MRRAMILAATAATLVLAACGGADRAAVVPPEKATPAEETARPTEETTAAAEAVKLTADLRGPGEVPPGDPDGSGSATFSLTASTGEICYEITVENIGSPITAAHLHEGEAGTAGPAVVTLEAPTEGSVDACAKSEPALVQRTIANPSLFYVNVHNQEFPAGAVRGQLRTA